jgi:predicted dehydrogenase
MIDLLQWYFGSVEKMYAYVDRLLHEIEVEDVAAGLIKFQNNACGTILATTASSTNLSPTLSVYGTAGSVSIENFKYGGVVKTFGRNLDIIKNATYPHFNNSSGEIPVYAKNHAAQIVNFISAIKGKGKLLIDGEEGKKPLEIVLNMYKLAKTKFLEGK